MVGPGSDQAELEAKEPAHGGTAPPGQLPQHPVATGPGVVTDRQPGAIDAVDAGGRATVAMEQEVKGRQAWRHQGHKPALGEKFGNAVTDVTGTPKSVETFLGKAGADFESKKGPTSWL